MATENLEDGLRMAARIEQLHALKRELKAGIQQTELGNYSAAFQKHPLYAEINAELAQLRTALTELI